MKSLFSCPQYNPGYTLSQASELPTLRLLLAHPRFLTREYLDGRRVHYVRPLQLVLLLFPVIFLYRFILFWIVWAVV